MIILQIVLVTAYETHNIVLGENSQVSETITVFGTECTETEKVNIFIIFVMSILPNKFIRFHFDSYENRYFLILYRDIFVIVKKQNLITQKLI